MRTFIAIELSDEIKDALDRIESHLKYSGADVKWVAKDNIHLTLKFLGEVDEKKCEKVKAALDEIAKSTASFKISLKDIGAFPKIEFPRVIWVGLDKGTKESTELAAKIDEALSAIGFDRETRPFAAHLTIGRVRSPKNKAALAEKVTSHKPVRSEAEPPRRGQVTSSQAISLITLFQSKLTPTGPIYTKLHEAKFVG
jgi:2'-5' RNA ligase